MCKKGKDRSGMNVLVAGIGNIFLGDDAFGVEVAQVLLERELPHGVTVKDFGIRGFDLAYSLLDPWDTVILVNAMPRGEVPGTLCLLEPDVVKSKMRLRPHAMDPVHALEIAALLGNISAKVFMLGCEPLDFGDEIEGRMGLSTPVQAAVKVAVKLVLQLACFR